MPKSDTTLSDAEWEARFNGPRNKLLKEIFGDIPCPIKDISPKVVFKDKRWENNDDFMLRKRIHDKMNVDMTGVAEWNEQLRLTGRFVTQLEPKALSEDSKSFK